MIEQRGLTPLVLTLSGRDHDAARCFFDFPDAQLHDLGCIQSKSVSINVQKAQFQCLASSSVQNCGNRT